MQRPKYGCGLQEITALNDDILTSGLSSLLQPYYISSMAWENIMGMITSGNENSPQEFDKSSLIGAKEGGRSIDLKDLEDVSFLIRCSNHFPPKKLQSRSC